MPSHSIKTSSTSSLSNTGSSISSNACVPYAGLSPPLPKQRKLWEKAGRNLKTKDKEVKDKEEERKKGFKAIINTSESESNNYDGQSKNVANIKPKQSQGTPEDREDKRERPYSVLARAMKDEPAGAWGWDDDEPSPEHLADGQSRDTSEGGEGGDGKGEEERWRNFNMDSRAGISGRARTMKHDQTAMAWDQDDSDQSINDSTSKPSRDTSEGRRIVKDKDGTQGFRASLRRGFVRLFS